jgi:hypothetical protein
MEKRVRTEEEISMLRFIELGRLGHYPLFFREWIQESYAKKAQHKNTSVPTTKEYVYKIFSELEKHKNLERKKTFLEMLSNDERNKFIRSFMYLVEVRALDKTQTLQ